MQGRRESRSSFNMNKSKATAGVERMTKDARELMKEIHRAMITVTTQASVNVSEIRQGNSVKVHTIGEKDLISAANSRFGCRLSASSLPKGNLRGNKKKMN